MSAVMNMPKFDGTDYSVEELKEQWGFYNQVSDAVDYERGRILNTVATKYDLESFRQTASLRGKSITKNQAKLLINFYMNANELRKPSDSSFEPEYVPSAAVERVCQGITPAEKLENYNTIKEILGTENPSTREIKVFNGRESYDTKNTENPKIVEAREKGESYRRQKEFAAKVVAKRKENSDKPNVFHETWRLEDVYKEKHQEPKRESNALSEERNAIRVLEQLDLVLWKKTYRKLAKVVHPDQGGSEDQMRMLTTINSVMVTLHAEEEFTKAKEVYNKEMDAWVHQELLKIFDEKEI